ncbi:EamA family transporter [Sneathiella chungangensis]|uniref:EamA family transporter n=1 Tax=Sneathiella chungangensis TaxID=1418234 RepID=A0A845MJ73_9PROT|nr:DMT family transporter [Sneathiella chungangensis]MZR23366.1 EamA family transporter [Sneathiella chungangensis]
MTAEGDGVSWRGFLSRIPANGQGALWMLLGGFCFSCMGLGIKFLGAEMDSFQIAFLRALFGFFVILPFALRRGISGLRTRVLKLHLARGVVGILGMLSIFYAITHLPLADAVALTFTRPLFLILLAVLLLGEKIRWRRWTATAVGFLGVLIMVQSQAQFEFASLVALFGALMVALVSVFLKKLSVTEAPTTMMFYFGLIASVVSAFPAALVWVPPSLEDLLLIALLACFGSGANFCAIRAFSVGEATAVAPFDYTRLIFSGLLGFIVFSEVPTLAMVIGAGIIVISSLYIVRREAGLGRKKPLVTES